jgi:hypothetical protein
VLNVPRLRRAILGRRQDRSTVRREHRFGDGTRLFERFAERPPGYGIPDAKHAALRPQVTRLFPSGLSEIAVRLLRRMGCPMACPEAMSHIFNGSFRRGHEALTVRRVSMCRMSPWCALNSWSRVHVRVSQNVRGLLPTADRAPAVRTEVAQLLLGIDSFTSGSAGANPGSARRR